ncbi:MAG: hypothetical protein KDA44_12220 [Planctomycetales bacterium]|nr:hypothetical protein [Planctomycetales bacterium]
MGSRSLTNLCAVVFFALGVLAISLRHQSRQAVHVAETDSLWKVTYRYQLESGGDANIASYVDIGLPRETPFAKFANEPKITFPIELKAEELGPFESGTQVLRVTATHPGKYPLTAVFDMALSPEVEGWSPAMTKESLSASDEARYTKDEDLLPKSSPAVQREVRRLPRGDGTTDSQRLELLFEFCRTDLREAENDPLADQVPNVLADKKATPLGRARTFVSLCRAAGMPARLVVGFNLQQDRSASPHVWSEVYSGNRWIPFDPEYGYSRRMPSTFFPVRHGREEGEVWVVPPSSAMQGVMAQYTIERMAAPESLLTREVRHPRQILDLTRLPLEMHQAMSLILLLPFGAVITAIFRNIVGLKTFGTFAPALLAMSFIYANWSTGIAILGVVLTAGFASRRFLERLRLLMVPRLSIVLTIIILCIMFVVSVLDYSGLTPSPQAVLLPMVILTTLTERYYVTSEEDGHAFAMKLSFGTLIVAAMCYAVLSWRAVGNWILAYPEAHFITIAVFMVIGRYTGYRLSELIRFRDFVKGQEA